MGEPLGVVCVMNLCSFLRTRGCKGLPLWEWALLLRADADVAAGGEQLEEGRPGEGRAASAVMGTGPLSRELQPPKVLQLASRWHHALQGSEEGSEQNIWGLGGDRFIGTPAQASPFLGFAPETG